MTTPPTQSRILFKQCPCCGAVWESRQEFLSDPAIHLIGYQPLLTPDMAGFFLFNHARCGTSLGLALAVFQDFAEELEAPEPARREGEVRSWCLVESGGPDCPPKCLCRVVRQISARIEIATLRPPGNRRAA